MSYSAKTPQNSNLIEEKFIVKYKDENYDITEFMLKHPGGVNTLIGYNRKTIDKIFESVEHSPAAEYLLNDYKLKKLSIEPNSLDDSMEHLVDWNLSMAGQISKLGDKYVDWVNKPVDRKLILFANPILESLTKTPWYLPLVFWIPIVSYLIMTESTLAPTNTKVCIHLIGGFILWTFIEYMLHRFVFHMNVKDHPKWINFHFIIHGLHHKVPFDGERLVFPPVAAALLATILYLLIKVPITLLCSEFIDPKLILAGGLIGYLCYDMTHYYIHYGSPRIKFFYNLKRLHHNHHFVNHDKGFGISSPMWDIAFRTQIILKKLKYLLKW